jgi:hypothetical protein
MSDPKVDYDLRYAPADHRSAYDNSSETGLLIPSEKS